MLAKVAANIFTGFGFFCAGRCAHAVNDINIEIGGAGGENITTPKLFLLFWQTPEKENMEKKVTNMSARTHGNLACICQGFVKA